MDILDLSSSSELVCAKQDVELVVSVIAWRYVLNFLFS